MIKKRFVLPLIVAAAVFMLNACEAPEPDPEVDERPNVAVLVTEGFHDGEAFMPMGYLANRGALLTVIGPQTGTVQAYNSEFTIRIDMGIDEVTVDYFDALILPGGEAPEALRENEDVVAFTREFFESGKPVAGICHGPQVLVTAGVLEGFECTGVGGIQEEIEEAGATYLDESVVVDRNLITSRVPGDLSDFSKAIENALKEEGFLQN